MGLIAGIICTIFALFINFLNRFGGGNFLKLSSQFLSLGYALPGLVLAVGIIQFFSLIDNSPLVLLKVIIHLSPVQSNNLSDKSFTKFLSKLSLKEISILLL